MTTIDQLRNEVDAIDSKILDLLSERMKLIRKIAEQKKKMLFCSYWVLMMAKARQCQG